MVTVRIGLACFLAVWLSACVAPPLKPAPSQVDSRQLLRGLADNAARYQSLRGLAKVRVESPQRNFGARQVLLARKPDRLRAETLSLFGTPMLLLASDGQQMQVLVPGQNRFYQGAASSRNLQRFANLPLHLEDLVRLLLYQVPLFDQVEHLETTPEGPVLHLAGNGTRGEELRFDNRFLLTGLQLTENGETWLVAEYADFGTDGFPRTMRLRLPQRDTLLEVTFLQLEINPSLEPERFVLARPEGARLIELPGD